MSHFYMLVVMPPGTAPNEIDSALASMMAPFYQWKEVAPYRDYLEDETIQELLAKYGVSNLSELSKLLNAEHDPEDADLDFAADKHGLYRMSTYNPLAEWDNYRVIDSWQLGPISMDGGKASEIAIRVRDIPLEIHPYGVVYPDAGGTPRWLAHQWNDVAQNWDDPAFDEAFAAILSEHADYLAVLLDCHF